MFYHREHLIERQVLQNKKTAKAKLVNSEDLKQLYSRAYEELRLSKINNCELDFNNINLFLLLSTPRQQNDFFLMLKQAIAQILADDRKRRIFQDKWSAVLRSNCMKLFYKLGQQMLDPIQADWKKEMLKLYVQVAEKVLTNEKIWRIEEKFLEGFITESLSNLSEGRRILGDYREDLYQIGKRFSQSPAATEIPKSLSNVHYLQFGLLRILEIAIPNQQYLQNQFLHSPNPKFLLPLSTRKTFTPLTNQMLLKLNKVDMVALKFWHMYEYEPSDIYEKIRKARGWEPKVEVLLLGIKAKLQEGLFRYINLINDLVLRHANKECSEEVSNQLVSYVQIALEICSKHAEPAAEETALEKIDIGLAFQFNTIVRSARQKQFVVRLVELYLILMLACRKQKIKIRSIKDISTNIYRQIKFNHDQKLTREMCQVIDKHFGKFSPDEKEEFFMEIIREVNAEWSRDQKNSPDIVKVDSNVLTLLAHTVLRHDLAYLNKNKLSVLEFLLILSLNQNEKTYNQAKKSLCYLNVELGYSLAGSTVFGFLQNRQNPTFRQFREKLYMKYGVYEFDKGDFDKYEFEGLLAIIDQIVVFRITGLRERIVLGLPLTKSYFSVLVQFLEETQKLSKTMFRLVERYFDTCVRTYMIEFRRARVKDHYKDEVRELSKLDVSFLIQSTASANPVIAKFSLNCLQSFIEEIPEMAFFTRMLMVFIEAISFLYEKVSQEYDSKSEVLRGKYLTENVLIPTDIKEISHRLINIMCALYQIILRGHCIHDNYLKMRVGYLVREQNTRTNKLSFGCKFLKYLINNFKQDREFIDRQVLIGNSCLWWINEEEFSKRIRMLKGESVLLDKSLLPLHRNDCSIKDLQNIFISVRPQIETEFLIVPQESSYEKIDQIVSQVNLQASQVHKLELQEDTEEAKENAHNKLFEYVGQVKMIQLSQTKKVHLLSQLLDVCKQWLNRGLLKYILFKIVPFLYCSGSYNSGIIALIAQMLHYLTTEINKTGTFTPTLHVSDQDIFNLKLDFLVGVQDYEVSELSDNFLRAYDSIRRSRKIINPSAPSSHYIVLKLYEARFQNLKKMQKVLLKFLSQHLQVNLAKGVKLSLISAIVFENLKLKKVVLEHLPLESICYALKSQLEFVNVLKASLDKDEYVYDAGLSVDYLYYKTLKMGLYHFQKLNTFYNQQLIIRSTNVQSLQSKIAIFIQVCNYLNNEGLHKIPNKRKINKDELRYRNNRTKQVSVIVDNLKRTQRAITGTDQTRNRRVYQNRPGQEIIVQLPVMRSILLNLISQRIDKAKGFSYSELSKIPNPYSLAYRKRIVKNIEVQQLLAILGDKSLVLIYNIACTFGHCLENPASVFQMIGQRLSKNPRYNFSEFLDLYINNTKDHIARLKEINYWKVPHIQLLLKYLTNDYDNISYLQLYVTKILSRLRSQQLLFYLPQIYQTLTLRSGEVIFKFMLEYAEKSTLFAHQLIWISKVQAKQEIDPHNKTKRTPEINAHLQKLSLRSMEVIEMAIRNMGSEETSFFHMEDDFFERVTAISGKLLPKMPTDVKRNIIQEELEKIPVTPEIYMPTNPRFQVSAIKLDSGMPMQSAAKCPILVTFYCTRYGGPDQYFQQKILAKKKRKFEEFDKSISQDMQKQPSVSSHLDSTVSRNHNVMSKTEYKPTIDIDSITLKFDDRKTIKNGSAAPRSKKAMDLQSPSEPKQFKFGNEQVEKQVRTEVSCIFKVFDDIRQDCLALQIIRLMQEIFDKNNLDLFLYPYKTISNRTGRELDMGGIIECVPNTLSRDGIGKINRESLYEYFINKFGPEHNQNFQQARDNFIKSQAAYSVVSYLLQIKDRHNGNILINNEGYLIHIDFGFIFDISPAGNLKFESANFKLTDQMIKIMGGNTSSQPFSLYLNLVIKAFLVVRKYHEHIYNTVKQMVKSGLPCFLPQSLQNLHKRFALQMNDFEAANYMKCIVYDAADKWTTNWYDRIQWIQQKIYH